MAGVRQNGWRAILAVHSEYGADTLPDRYRSADRFRLVHARYTTLSTVIVAEEHSYQIHMDYFNTQK